MTENMCKWPPVHRKTEESGHRMPAEKFLFPDGEVLHEDNPDFLATEAGPLGIELRQLFHPRPSIGPPLQALESVRDAVMEEAQELCELRGLPPLFVSVDFDLRTPVAADRRYLIARKLAQLCADFLPSKGKLAELNREPLKPKLLPEEIRGLYIDRTGRSHHWTGSAALSRRHNKGGRGCGHDVGC